VQDRRCYPDVEQEACVDADLNTLVTALYVQVDDLLKANPDRVPWRPVVGIAPRISGAELVTLAVPQALLGFTSEARWPPIPPGRQSRPTRRVPATAGGAGSVSLQPHSTPVTRRLRWHQSQRSCRDCARAPNSAGWLAGCLAGCLTSPELGFAYSRGTRPVQTFVVTVE